MTRTFSTWATASLTPVIFNDQHMKALIVLMML